MSREQRERERESRPDTIESRRWRIKSRNSIEAGVAKKFIVDRNNSQFVYVRWELEREGDVVGGE